jgi:hypothetical protein
MTEEFGFYKAEGGQLIHAPNKVENLNYVLIVNDYLSYNYPIDGWYYFSSKEEAIEFFGDQLEDIDEAEL